MSRNCEQCDWYWRGLYNPGNKDSNSCLDFKPAEKYRSDRVKATIRRTD